MKRTLRDLIHAHAGRAAVIIGGGMSAVEQIGQCPVDAIFISANQHGCIARKCDYIFCADAIEEKVFERPDGSTYTLRSFNTPIISPRPAGDYWMFEQPLPSSGVMTAWCAWVMGCAPIIPVGMDCYQGDATYYHDVNAISSGNGLSLQRHIARWELLKAQAPGGQFRAIGGPLLDVFPKYDRKEPAARPFFRDVLADKVAGAMVQFTRPSGDLVAPRMYMAGDRAEISKKLAKRAVQRGIAEYLEEVAA